MNLGYEILNIPGCKCWLLTTLSILSYSDAEAPVQ